MNIVVSMFANTPARPCELQTHIRQSLNVLSNALVKGGDGWQSIGCRSTVRRSGTTMTTQGILHQTSTCQYALSTRGYLRDGANLSSCVSSLSSLILASKLDTSGHIGC